MQFEKYKDMQRQLQRERELWDEQHAGGARPPAAGLQRAAFNMGSVFGSVRNAIVAGAAGQGRPSGEGAAAAAVVPLERYEAAAASSLPVRTLFCELKRALCGRGFACIAARLPAPADPPQALP